jgi:pimeloyl-ACP methyl ester carboxylesterase
MLSLGHRRFSVAGHSLGGGIALQTAYQFPERVDRLILLGSGGLGSEVSVALRAATLPGAEAVVSLLSAIPAAVLNRALAALPDAIAGPDATLVAGVLSGLHDEKHRTAFLRTARSVIDWRGQAVSAQRQTDLLHGLPVLVAWGYPHETHSDRGLESLQAFLAATAQFEYSEASWVARLTLPPSLPAAAAVSITKA